MWQPEVLLPAYFTKNGTIPMTRFFITLVAALCFSTAWAQQDPFAEMQHRMMEMQRRMMQQLQNMSPDGGMGRQMDSTSFFFRFDTAFGGDLGKGNFHFFRSSPFGQDSMRTGAPMGDFWGFDSFFDDFFNFNWPPAGLGDMQEYRLPADDGNAPADEDGLLPEERLRLQEKKGKEKPEHSAKPAEKPKDKRAKVETIRI